MKTRSSSVRMLEIAFRVTCISALFGAALQLASAQVGNENPTGPAGVFGRNITTGCSYNPFTGNAMRSVTDLVVAGGAGSYPLAFTRVSNSRMDVSSAFQFGVPGGWQHSYAWRMAPSAPSTSQTPPSYEVFFPDGRDENFTSSGARAVPGIPEQVKPLDNFSFVYLILADGGKVAFQATQHASGGTYYYTYIARTIFDPYGRRTELTYDADGNLYQITEPGSRWIRLFYMTTPWYNSSLVQDIVIDHITGSDGRTVQYGYDIAAFWADPALAYRYTFLANVTYYGNNTIKALYSYQAPNGGNINGGPLLASCDDPMYEGPMKKISYTYATSNGDPIVEVAVGQIDSEKSGTTGQIVSQLYIPYITWRTEIRGDGPSRVFTYNGPYVRTAEDFNGITATQAYDANGFLNWFQDRNGNVTDLTRDATTGNIKTMTFPSTPGDTPAGTPRGTVTFTYGSDPHYLDSVTDEGGNTTVYLRDANKHVSQINYPDNGYETFAYDLLGHVFSHRLKTGGTETFTYYLAANGDAAYLNGLVKEYRDPYHGSGNPNARYQYDTLSRVSGVTDALGSALGDVNHTTSYAYNSRGEVTTTTHPKDPADGLPHTITNAYNLNTGTLTSATDELGHVTSYTYDDYRRVRTMTSPGHNTPVTARYFYDANGTSDNYRLTPANVTFGKTPAGEVVKTVYDNNLRKASLTAGSGTSDAATTQYGRDNEGNLTTVTAPNQSSITTTAYDERNRPMSITDALNNPSTTFKYDAAGRKASVTRPNGQVTTYDSYNAMNRLTQQTVKQSPNPNAVTKYTYDATGLLQTMKDPRLVANGSSYNYSYDYDLMGRKTRLTYPPDSGSAQRTESWTYDVVNRLATFKNRAGNVQTFTYDALNRVTLSNWSDTATPDVTTTYDAASRITSITNANAAITRVYFNDNLLNTETVKYGDGINRAVTYTYDGDGRRASLQYPNGAYSFNYNYTARDQLNTIVSGGATPANYDYDVNGNLKTRTLNNSTSSTFGYDPMDRVTSISHALVGGTRTFAYGYDSVGNRNFVKRDGGNGDAYDYDLDDQATAVKLNIANPNAAGAAGAQTISYDANGNRTSFAAYDGTTDTYTINGLNQYTGRNSSQATYDLKGNMTTGLDGSTCTYDAQNRLLTATKAGTTATFTYDGLNRQIGKKIGTQALFYRVYDRWNLLGEYQSGSTGAFSAYLHGVGGVIKNLVTNRYYYRDASGSTSHLGQQHRRAAGVVPLRPARQADLLQRKRHPDHRFSLRHPPSLHRPAMV